MNASMRRLQEDVVTNVFETKKLIMKFFKMLPSKILSTKKNKNKNKTEKFKSSLKLKQAPWVIGVP